MQQLHLVGFTTDLEGLIFSTRKGAKSGGFMVLLDDQLLDSIQDAQRLREDQEAGPADPRQQEEAFDPLPVRRRSRPHSELSPREIQARLRSGSSVAEVAREAGVDEEWVLRFAPPIVAEQARVVEQARQLTFVKARLGPSSQPLGTSVQWNTAERGVHMSEEEYEESWSAFNLQGTSWVVRFAFTSRGRRQSAEWHVDLRSAELTARNRLASDLGYVEPGRKRSPSEGSPPEAPAPRRAPRTGKGTRKAAGVRKPAKKTAQKAAKKTAKKAPKKAAKKAGARTASARRPRAVKEQGVVAAAAGGEQEAPLPDRPTHLARPPSPMNAANRVSAGSLPPAPRRQPSWAGGQPASPPVSGERPVAGRRPGEPSRSEPRRPPPTRPADVWTEARQQQPPPPPPPQSPPADVWAERRPGLSPDEEGWDDVRPSRPPQQARPQMPRQPPQQAPPQPPRQAPGPPPRPPSHDASPQEDGGSRQAQEAPPASPEGQPGGERRRPLRAAPSRPPPPPPVAVRRPPPSDGPRDVQPPAVVILPPPEEPARGRQGEAPQRRGGRARPPEGEELEWSAPPPAEGGPAVRIRADLAEGGSEGQPEEEAAGEEAPANSRRARRGERRWRASKAP